MDKELVMYSRTYGCPFVTVARRVFDDYGLGYREIMIDRDSDARDRVLRWNGFQSVPTIIVARVGELEPYVDPEPLANGASPRGLDRGALITEPNLTQLERWLVGHNFIREDDITSRI